MYSKDTSCLSTILVAVSIILATIIIPSTEVFAEKSVQICSDNEQFIMRRLASEQQDNICHEFKGQVMLVVNTASRCAYTDQYDDLEKLYAQYKDQGLVVVGFPSNDFGNQEPGSENKIKDFCRLTYGVKFPMYAKTRVKGKNADPFYKKLAEVSGQTPQWNFHKYLIDRNGNLVGSYQSAVNPYNKQLIEMLEQHL